MNVNDEGLDLYDGLAGFFDDAIEFEGKKAAMEVTLLDLPPILHIQLQVRYSAGMECLAAPAEIELFIISACSLTVKLCSNTSRMHTSSSKRRCALIVSLKAVILLSERNLELYKMNCVLAVIGFIA